MGATPQLTASRIPDVLVIVPPEFPDSRGTFAETYNQRTFTKLGVSVQFVQDNQSVSAQKGTIRGLHFQIPPVAQTKLVRVTRGSIFDVAVDLRLGSPTYGQYVSQVISEGNRVQFLIPEGFAHGFCTLEDHTVVLYKVSDYYSPPHERGVRWDDRTLRIDWPVASESALVSARDKEHPSFDRLPAFFSYSTNQRGPDAQTSVETAIR